MCIVYTGVIFMKLGMRKRRSIRRIAVSMMCLVGLMFAIHKLLKRAEPVFVAQCSNYSNTAFTDLVNKCVIDASESGEFKDFFYASESAAGTIASVEADTGRINRVVSRLLIDIQNRLNDDYPAKIKIPIGAVTNYYLLSSAGPKLPIYIEPISIVNGHYEEKFESAGINQVQHKIALNVTVDMHYRGYLMDERETIEITVPIAETVISGAVPQYYGGNLAYSK